MVTTIKQEQEELQVEIPLDLRRTFAMHLFHREVLPKLKLTSSFRSCQRSDTRESSK